MIGRLLRKLLPPRVVEGPCVARGDRLFVISEYEVGQFPLLKHTQAIFDERAIDCVIDVGANEGQFARFIRKDVGFKGQILSFEPADGPHKRLAAAAASDPLWSVFKIALGARREQKPLNVMRDSVFNSFSTPANALFVEQNEVVETQIIAVERLDTFLSENGWPFERAFLKIDTQGFDLNVIRGAEKILAKVEAVQAELAFLPIYKDIPLYDEVLDELRSHGFAISGMYPISVSSLQAIEMDGLLVRERPMQPGDHNDYCSVLNRHAVELRGDRP